MFLPSFSDSCGLYNASLKDFDCERKQYLTADRRMHGAMILCINFNFGVGLAVHQYERATNVTYQGVLVIGKYSCS